MGHRAYLGPGLTILVMLAAGAAGCGTGSSPATPAGATTAASTLPTTGYAAADAQYRQIQLGLNLPPGVTFPQHLTQSGVYTAESGLVAAQNYWFCAWLWRYVDTAATAKSQAQAAVAEIAKYDRMDAYTKALDGKSRPAVDGAIKAAQSGSRQRVEAFSTSTCAGPFFGQSHPTGS